MSGELFRVRIDFGRSIVTVVRRVGTPSIAPTWSSHSPSDRRSIKLKRVGVALRVAPRPWFDSTGMAKSYARRGTYQEHCTLSWSNEYYGSGMSQQTAAAARRLTSLAYFPAKP